MNELSCATDVGCLLLPVTTNAAGLHFNSQHLDYVFYSVQASIILRIINSPAQQAARDVYPSVLVETVPEAQPASQSLSASTAPGYWSSRVASCYGRGHIDAANTLMMNVISKCNTATVFKLTVTVVRAGRELVASGTAQEVKGRDSFLRAVRLSVAPGGASLASPRSNATDLAIGTCEYLAPAILLHAASSKRLQTLPFPHGPVLIVNTLHPLLLSSLSRQRTQLEPASRPGSCFATPLGPNGLPVLSTRYHGPCNSVRNCPRGPPSQT